MKIKRFFATDMRNAIRQVRETLGADAVILSNKPVDGGVELMAALDFDASAFADQQPAVEYVDSQPKESVVTPFPPEGSRPAEAQADAAEPRAQKIEWSQDPVLTDMRQEMQALRRMMENELSELTWRDMGKRQPEVQELLRRLMVLGLSPEICQDLVRKCDGFSNLDHGWRKALYFLASQIETTGDDLLEHGGAVAIIGPTGVGKTTTLAKLASRYALRHGNRHVALISTDNYRIGAQEQLTTYARILDVPMRSAANAEELGVALNAFADKRLILIDTAGMSQRDVRISEQLSLLRTGNKRVRSLLTLSATTQQAAMRHAIDAFGVAAPDAMILTKLDEAGSLGGVLSAIVDSKLKVSYVTDGQKVPEDLHLARPHTLVSRSVNLAYQGGAGLSEEFLALALGGTRADAHV
ncbi:MAG: flagellar biosynthesis protein FlhF [Gammaproteobacteria bacterium]|nr:flagellar biosynthesis protein FlhF [Gammaproteobacteria bacterium]